MIIFIVFVQTIWDNELQSILQMGFASNPPINNPGPNGKRIN